MKIRKIIIKKEYILYYYYIYNNTPMWFFDEPVKNKKDLIDRIKWLKDKNAKINIKTRFTIEI